MANKVKETDKFYTVKATVYLLSAAGMSAVIGFGSALAWARKHDPEYFEKGVTLKGGSIPLRAFGRGTLYACTGCGILFYSAWKLLGVNNVKELKIKMGSVFPEVPKSSQPQGRTDFEGLTDFLQYVSETHTSSKESKVSDGST